MTFDRITIDPAIMGGKPCIRGLRMPVATIIGHLRGGATAQEILDQFPFLEAEDVNQAIAFDDQQKKSNERTMAAV